MDTRDEIIELREANDALHDILDRSMSRVENLEAENKQLRSVARRLAMFGIFFFEKDGSWRCLVCLGRGDSPYHIRHRRNCAYHACVCDVHED